MNHILPSLQALFLVLSTASVSTILPALSAAGESSITETRRYTVDWSEPQHSGPPPYLKGYELLESSVRGGTGYMGTYVGTGSDMVLHRSLLGRITYPYPVTGTETDSEFVVAVNIAWHDRYDEHPAVVGSLLVTLDDRDSLVVALAFRGGKHFFLSSGTGMHHSFPEVLVFDIPPGEHVVRLRMLSNPSAVALVVCGILEDDAEDTPSAKPDGESSEPEESESSGAESSESEGWGKLDESEKLDESGRPDESGQKSGDTGSG
jgi:hypothetical protein